MSYRWSLPTIENVYSWLYNSKTPESFLPQVTVQLSYVYLNPQPQNTTLVIQLSPTQITGCVISHSVDTKIKEMLYWNNYLDILFRSQKVQKC